MRPPIPPRSADDPPPNRSTTPASAPVLVLNWNGWDDTLECVRSLAEAVEAPEVWVVDNGSSTDRSDELRDALPGVRVVKLGENHGWAGGYNRALQLAVEEGRTAAYLLNNDTRVDPRFLAEAEAAAGEVEDGAWAAVGSRILHPDGSVHFDGAYHAPGARGLEGTAGPVRVVEAAYGSGMLVNLSAWSAVGPFDERFFCYHEEVEWCMRAAGAGYASYVAPRSLVCHEEEGSDTNSNAAYYRGRNRFLLADARGRGRRVEKVRAALSLWRGAARARKAGRGALERALLQALHDALRSRYGRRGEWTPSLPFRLLSRAWPARRGQQAATTGPPSGLPP